MARHLETGSRGINKLAQCESRAFLKKRLWQTRLYDHVIRNDVDLQENLDYIAMNPVREGYVRHPQVYPYTGFLL